VVRPVLLALVLGNLLVPSSGAARGFGHGQAFGPTFGHWRDHPRCMTCRNPWGYSVVEPEDDYAGATEHEVPREHDGPTERDVR
jgi:hypothetical protein